MEDNSLIIRDILVFLFLFWFFISAIIWIVGKIAESKEGKKIFTVTTNQV